MRYLVLPLLLVAAGCGGDGSSDCPAPSEVAPRDSAGMFEYLRCNQYSGLTAEMTPHTSTGPHRQSGVVRTYINATLRDSLVANNGEHPEGSAAIKVFLDQGSDEPRGWAAMVKTQATSDGGQGWYWYENFSTTDNDNPIEGQGLGLCTGCHGGATRDYFLTTFPLQ